MFKEFFSIFFLCKKKNKGRRDLIGRVGKLEPNNFLGLIAIWSAYSLNAGNITHCDVILVVIVLKMHRYTWGVYKMKATEEWLGYKIEKIWSTFVFCFFSGFFYGFYVTSQDTVNLGRREIHVHAVVFEFYQSLGVPYVWLMV